GWGGGRGGFELGAERRTDRSPGEVPLARSRRDPVRGADGDGVRDGTRRRADAARRREGYRRGPGRRPAAGTEPLPRRPWSGPVADGPAGVPAGADTPTFGRVRSRSVYPGIDLLHYGAQGRQLEYDFVVAPGADPGVIRLAFDGADRLKLDRDGDLVLYVGATQLRLGAPRVYQAGAAGRRAVAGAWGVGGGDTAGVPVRGVGPRPGGGSEPNPGRRSRRGRGSAWRGY